MYNKHNLRTLWNHLSRHYVEARVKWSSLSALILLVSFSLMKTQGPVITFQRNWCSCTVRDSMKLMWIETARHDWDGHLKAPKVVFNGPSKRRKHKFTVYLADSYKRHCAVKCTKAKWEDIPASPTEMEDAPVKGLQEHGRGECMDSHHRALEARPEWIWVMFAFCEKGLFLKAAEKPEKGKCAVNSYGISPQHFTLPFKETVIISFFLFLSCGKEYRNSQTVGFCHTVLGWRIWVWQTAAPGWTWHFIQFLWLQRWMCCKCASQPALQPLLLVILDVSKFSLQISHNFHALLWVIQLNFFALTRMRSPSDIFHSAKEQCFVSSIASCHQVSRNQIMKV